MSETISLEKPETMIVIRPCGCMAWAAVYHPESREFARECGKAMQFAAKNGWTFTTAKSEQVRANPWGCVVCDPAKKAKGQQGEVEA